MAFPAEVTLRTTQGAEYVERQDVPLGGAGRPWDETKALVREKFLSNFAGDESRAGQVLDAIDGLEQIGDVREICSLLSV
jgi:hypothetical protein